METNYICVSNILSINGSDEGISRGEKYYFPSSSLLRVSTILKITYVNHAPREKTVYRYVFKDQDDTIVLRTYLKASRCSESDFMDGSS